MAESTTAPITRASISVTLREMAKRHQQEERELRKRHTLELMELVREEAALNRAALPKKVRTNPDKVMGEIITSWGAHPLTSRGADVVKAYIGAKVGRMRCDGKTAVLILDAIEPHGDVRCSPCGSGDETIVVRFKGRKTEMVFTVGDVWMTWDTRKVAQPAGERIAA